MQSNALVEDKKKGIKEHVPAGTAQSSSSKRQIRIIYCRTTGLTLHYSMAHMIQGLNLCVVDIKDQYSLVLIEFDLQLPFKIGGKADG